MKIKTAQEDSPGRCNKQIERSVSEADRRPRRCWMDEKIRRKMNPLRDEKNPTEELPPPRRRC